MNTIKYDYRCSLLIIAVIVISISSAYCRSTISQDEGKQKCAARTGLKIYEIDSFRSRNEGCAFDCTTIQGTIQTFYAKDNTECYNSRGYRCLLGKCLGPDVPSVDTNDLYNTEIRIVSAHVPDMDSVPSKGESDAFVVIKVKNSGHPTYNDGEIVCHTYTVVDDDCPRWKNFVCKPLPLKKDAMLTFNVWDSDKPVEIPDSLGVATESVDFLINRGPTKLRLIGPKSTDYDDYHIVVDIRGEEY